MSESRTTGGAAWRAGSLAATGLLLAIASLAIPASKHSVGTEFGRVPSGVLTVLFATALLGIVSLGCFVALRRPENPIGWLLAAGGCVFELDAVMQAYAGYARGHGLAGANLVLSVENYLWIPAVALTIIFVGLLFPTGKLLSPRWRWVARAAAAGLAAAYIGGTAASQPIDYNAPGAVNPLLPSGPALALANALSAALLLLPLFAIAAVVALVLRYRRGSGEERHQIRIVMFATSIYAITFPLNLAIHLITGHGVTWLEDIAVVGILAVPAGAGFAVLRYRLYDIDVVINRTLVYGALAAFITAVYVGIVVGVGALIGAGGKPNLALSILATAVVAIAFQPVRERVQRVANRLVYGQRATPYEVLSDFSSRVAESYAGEEVLPRMAQVLAEGTGAAQTAVWLRGGNSLRRAAAWPLKDEVDAVAVELDGQLLPALPGADRAVAVRHQGELLGALSVRKRSGELLTPIENKLLDDLAHQAGLVLRNVGLTADLQARLVELRASRQRLVAAQDEERRRLERNLHDGAQQNLVALKIKLGLAQTLTARDPARSQELIAELKADADDALEIVRALARGIYPPLLAERGLPTALQAQARKATLPVTVEADGIGRYSQEAEAALYFCILEALQNIQKYAQASSATVRLREERDRLCVEVADDGRGFHIGTIARGNGLTNMEDRLNALGGTLHIASAPGDGTTVRAQIPVSPLMAVKS